MGGDGGYDLLAGGPRGRKLEGNERGAEKGDGDQARVCFLNEHTLFALPA